VVLDNEGDNAIRRGGPAMAINAFSFSDPEALQEVSAMHSNACKMQRAARAGCLRNGSSDSLKFIQQVLDNLSRWRRWGKFLRRGGEG